MEKNYCLELQKFSKDLKNLPKNKQVKYTENERKTL